MSDHEPSPPFGSPFRILVDYCETTGIKFRADPEVQGIFFSMRGEMAIYDVALLVTHEDEVFQIYITLPVATSDEKLRPLVAEFVTRANHRIVIGHFDYDMDEGRLRYHVGHPLGAGGLDAATVGRLFATAMGTADRYFPALMRTVVGGFTPADAVYLSELDYHAEAADAAGEPSDPPPPARPAPAPKKRGRTRKDPRSGSARELPGLFDEKPGEDKNPPKS